MLPFSHTYTHAYILLPLIPTHPFDHKFDFLSLTKFLLTHMAINYSDIISIVQFSSTFTYTECYSPELLLQLLSASSSDARLDVDKIVPSCLN
jgi:hypothetical protein